VGKRKKGRKLELRLVKREASRRESLELSVQIHCTGKVLKHRDSVDVKIAKHGIALPSAEEADQIAVNPGSDQGHGSGGAESFYCDIGWVETQ
jgi:hypothetical protein